MAARQTVSLLSPSDFPQVHRLSQLRRDPHLLGWFRWLMDQRPPFNRTRLHYLVASAVCSMSWPPMAIHAAGLILPADFPGCQAICPDRFGPDDDQRLQQELRRPTTCYSNALLLIRATGIRRSECSHLTLDCLRQLDRDQWALHVPLGKTHTERLVPADEEVRRLVDRILTLRAQAPARLLARSAGWLLPRCPIRYRSRRPCGDFIVLEDALCSYLDSRRRASRLLPARDPAPAPTYLCHGNGPLAREPACRHATAGA